MNSSSLICISGDPSSRITGKVFDTAIPQAERAMLVQFSFGLLLVALTQAAFKVTQSIAMIRVQGKMDYSAQAAVWDRLMDLPLTFFRKFSSGDLADRAGGIDQIRAIVAGAGIAALLGSFSSVFNVFQMMSYSVKLAAVAIGLSIAYVAATTTANYVQLRSQREEQKRRGRIMGLVLQLITGVAKLRVCGAENHAFRVWATAFAEQRKISFTIGRVKNFMSVFNAGGGYSDKLSRSETTIDSFVGRAVGRLGNLSAEDGETIKRLVDPASTVQPLDELCR